MIYFVKNKVEELPEIEYNDGVTKVYLYTNGILKGSEELKNLLLQGWLCGGELGIECVNKIIF